MTDSCPIPASKPYDRYDHVSYTPQPHNIPRARRHVAQLAIDWGHPGAAGDAALLATELCTNALLHGCLRGRGHGPGEERKCEGERTDRA